MRPYTVYVKTDDSGYITAVNSSAFLTDTTDWTRIDTGYGDKYRHAQGNYFPEPVKTSGGACRYKFTEHGAVACTEEEIAQQESANRLAAAPSQLDVLEAQVTYTAMMTDTLLEV